MVGIVPGPVQDAIDSSLRKWIPGLPQRGGGEVPKPGNVPSEPAPSSSPSRRTLHSNPPFSKEITNIYDLSTGGKFNLQRGFVKTDESTLDNGSGNVFYLFFLYNPSVLSVSHAVDNNKSVTHSANDTGSTLLSPLSQTLSFSLLFDRLYDVMKPTDLSGRYNKAVMSDLGVYADVLTLYDMLGITRQVKPEVSSKGGGVLDKPKAFLQGTSEEDAVGTNTSGGSIEEYLMRPVSPMVYTALRFYFSKQLIFKGVIQSLEVTYTHWTAEMVPNRCTVNMNVDLLPDVGTPPVSPYTVAADATDMGGQFSRAVPYIMSPIFGGNRNAPIAWDR